MCSIIVYRKNYAWLFTEYDYDDLCKLLYCRATVNDNGYNLYLFTTIAGSAMVIMAKNKNKNGSRGLPAVVIIPLFKIP